MPSEKNFEELMENVARGKLNKAKGARVGSPRKPHKYGAVATTVDGIRFPSKKEANRYRELKILEKAGQIFHLTLQPKFSIDINGVHICNYFADFQYLDADAKKIVEDVKGVKTPVYKLKKKLVKAIHGIDIVEV